MHSSLVILLLLLRSSLTDKCDSSVYKLAMFALANDNDDALERLKCSAEHYNIDFKILNMDRVLSINMKMAKFVLSFLVFRYKINILFTNIVCKLLFSNFLLFSFQFVVIISFFIKIRKLHFFLLVQNIGKILKMLAIELGTFRISNSTILLIIDGLTF